jgi:hypothetical protein
MAQATCYLRLAAEGGDGRRRRRDRSHPDAPRPQARAKQPAITHQNATDFSKQDALIVKRIEPRYGPNRTARAGKPVREAASKGGKHEIWPGPSRAAEDGGSSRRRSCWTDGGSRWREWAYRRRRFSGEFPRRRRRLIKRRSAVWVLVWGWGCGWCGAAGGEEATTGHGLRPTDAAGSSCTSRSGFWRTCFRRSGFGLGPSQTRSVCFRTKQRQATTVSKETCILMKIITHVMMTHVQK